MTDDRAKSVNHPRLGVVGFVYFEVCVPASASEPPPGREVFVAPLRTRLGGAFTTARVARDSGVDVVLISPLGSGLTDRIIRAELDSFDIDSCALPSRDDAAISLVFTQNGERSFVSSADFEALSRAGALPDSEWIHVAGLAEAKALESRLAEARRNGARVSISGSWVPERLEALRGRTEQLCDLLILNLDEAKFATGSALRAPELLRHVAPSVLVTDGPRGAQGILLGEKVKASVPRPLVAKDTTGAGDSFAGGLLAAIVRGESPDMALRAGIASATAHLMAGGGTAVEEVR